MTIQTLQQSENPGSDVIIPLVESEEIITTLRGIAQAAGMDSQLLENDFTGEAKQLSILYPTSQASRRWYLLGIGKSADYRSLCQAFRYLSNKLQEQLASQLAIDFAHSNLPDPQQSASSITAAVNGLLLGTYQIGLYKKEKKQHPLAAESASLHIITATDPKESTAAAERGQQIASTQLSIFDLVNAPSNKATPETLAQWALNSAEQYGYRCSVLDKDAIRQEGLHALLAVNQGSDYPPAFIILQYQPIEKSNDTLAHIGLVGKGVTFDTGGLSIKVANNMHFMKSDMGGAAAVLGAVELAARLQLPVRLTGIVPTTDNCVDAKSVKPGDVINSFSGKTIEVTDTDAEGRLILADGLAFIQQRHQPEVMIDLATLTGSSVRTFGYQCAALFTNNDSLADQLTSAGEACGERVWRLPLWEDYKKDLHSDVADVRNYSGRPVAGAISAAKFLEVFAEKHPAWAHLDIAGVAFGSSDFSKQRSATAFGILLLTDFIEKFKHHTIHDKNTPS